MAVDFKSEHTRTSEYLFWPKDILIKPELNGRHDLPNIDWLIEDIVKQGQLQPVLIRNEAGKAVLSAGFSRWRAISEINKRKLTPQPMKVRCCYFRGNEQEAFIANIQENRVRNATTELDDAYNMRRLERFGMTHEQIAEIYKADAPFVRRRLELVNLTKEAQEALKAGRLKGSAARAIAKLAAEQQREVVAGDGKVTTSQVRRAAAQDKPKRIGIGDVKEVLRLAIEDGKYPFETKGKSKEAMNAVDEFAQSLMEMVAGKPAVSTEEAAA